MKHPKLAAAVAACSTFPALLSAAPVTVRLDQSDVLSDGVGYLEVTIAEGQAGAIDFTVRVLDSLQGLGGGPFGIGSFAFNVAPGGAAEAASVANLSGGWTVRDGFRMDGFGLFDVKLYGGSTNPLATLSFSITGIDGDRPEDYAVLSTGKVTQGHAYFAARLASESCASPCVAGPFVAGAATVPAPAAGWLGITGVAALVLQARRRRAAD